MTADEADPVFAAEIRSWGGDPDAPVDWDYRSPDAIEAGRRCLANVCDKTAQEIVAVLLSWGVRYDRISDIDFRMAWHELDRREKGGAFA